jgi:hypothetical protein
MNTSTIATTRATDYELRFRSLRDAGRGYAFPCDPGGTSTWTR